jgi:hypothetical protein
MARFATFSFLLVTVVAAAVPGMAADAATAGATTASATSTAVTDALAADATAAATAPAGDAALLARITAQARTLTTVAGSFTQKTTTSDGDPPKLLTGTFAIEVPDKYSVVESRPGDPVWRLRLWSDGIGHWQSELQFAGMAPDVSAHDGDADLERVLACLRGDFAVLAADYRVIAAASGDGATVLLTPVKQGGDGPAGSGPVRIVLDHDLHARSVDIDQPGGQHVQITVATATYGQPSPAGSFTAPNLNP